jgi:hypothetical protein
VADDAITFVCETCGNDKTFLDTPPPARLVCERCGGTVWRAFETPSPDDQVAEDYYESTARHLTLGDPEPETTDRDRRERNL